MTHSGWAWLTDAAAIETLVVFLLAMTVVALSQRLWSRPEPAPVKVKAKRARQSVAAPKAKLGPKGKSERRTGRGNPLQGLSRWVSRVWHVLAMGIGRVTDRLWRLVRSQPRTRHFVKPIERQTVGARPLAGRQSLAEQMAKLFSIVRDWIASSKRAQTLHRKAWRQLDAVDYGLLKLRDELASVMPASAAVGTAFQSAARGEVDKLTADHRRRSTSGRRSGRGPVGSNRGRVTRRRVAAA